MKISRLLRVSRLLDGNELMPIVQDGETRSLSLTMLLNSVAALLPAAFRGAPGGSNNTYARIEDIAINDVPEGTDLIWVVADGKAWRADASVNPAAVAADPLRCARDRQGRGFRRIDDPDERWLRYRKSAPVVPQAGAVTLGAGVEERLLGIVTAAPGFAGDVFYQLGGDGARFTGELDGTDLPGAPWAGAGLPKGGAVYAAGASAANRLKNITIGGLWRNLKNGGANLENVEGALIEPLHLRAIQQGAGNVCAGLEVYFGRSVVAPLISVDGYRAKAISLNYAQSTLIGAAGTRGGTPGDANVHLYGGENLLIGGIVHDGGASFGYGVKVVDTRGLVIGPMVGQDCTAIVQNYGGHLMHHGAHVRRHRGAAADIDAYQARDSSPSAQLVHRGGYLVSERVGFDSIADVAVSIRGDNTRTALFEGDGAASLFPITASPSGFSWSITNPANIRAYVEGAEVAIAAIAGNQVRLAAAPAPGTQVAIVDITRTTPIDLVHFDRVDAIGGFAGVRSVIIPGAEINRVSIPGGVHASGVAAWPVYLAARSIDLGPSSIDRTVSYGFFFFTDSRTRGGVLRMRGVVVHGGAISPDFRRPLVQLGAPGTGATSRADFTDVVIEGDGNTFSALGLPSFQLLAGFFHRMPGLKRLALRNFSITDLDPATDGVTLDLSAQTDVRLELDNVRLLQTDGAPARVAITNPGAVTSGFRRDSILAMPTWPDRLRGTILRARITSDLSAVVAGSVQGFASPLAGVRAGDTVIVTARRAGIFISGAFVSADDQITTVVQNFTGAALLADEAFNVEIVRGQG